MVGRFFNGFYVVYLFFRGIYKEWGEEDWGEEGEEVVGGGMRLGWMSEGDEVEEGEGEGEEQRMDGVGRDGWGRNRMT